MTPGHVLWANWLKAAALGLCLCAAAPGLGQSTLDVPYRELPCVLRWGQGAEAHLKAFCSLYLVDAQLIVGAEVAEYPTATTLRRDLSFGAVIDTEAAWGTLSAIQIFELANGPVALAQPVGDLSALRPGALVEWPGSHRIEIGQPLDTPSE